jgi:MYXO-CTERM domain-containing protein
MHPPFSFAMPKKALFAIGGLILLFAARASATVNQPAPDNTPMPQPANPAEVSCCVVNHGYAADADTLAGLFMYNEINGGDPGLDPIKDAHTTPGTFSPQCGLKGTIVLHGGGCQNALGWYNATTPPSAPAANAIYPIVPMDLSQPAPAGLGCANYANKPPTPLLNFCPLASRTTTQGYGWAMPLPDFAADIRNDSHWAGGPVGFALIGNDSWVSGANCPQTKYSEADLNVKNSAGQPWITTLIYQSTSDPNGYYIAFEDQPTCTASWKGCDPGNPNQPISSGGNDGDFNDFVFYVSGIDCAGGGEVCDTGMPGICAGGTTQCANGGMSIKCRQDIQPRQETCNLLDDDCDGVIDNPDAPNLCPNGQVCYQGTCIPPCSTGEFPCIPPYQCDDSDGLCKDPACMNAKCASDQICYRGVCVGGCDNVVCPPGQVCRIGNCVDPCAGITCDSGQVCEGGACLAACGCRNCPSGKTCSSGGTCVDTGCDKLKCTSPEVCVQGQCKDGCAGVQCPAGQTCSNGECAIPDGGIAIPMPDGGVTGTGGDTGTGGRTGRGGSNGSGGNVGNTGGSNGSGGSTAPHEGGVTTCNCDSSAGPSSGGFALLLAALGLASLRRRAPSRAPRRR